MKKIANRDARHYVQQLQPFEGNHLYAMDFPIAKVYVVYSYGKHWPLFIYDYTTNQWFENEGKASVTTSKHRTQSHPHPQQPAIRLSLQWMERLAKEGYTAIAKARVVGGAPSTTWSFNNTTLRLV